MWYLKWGQVDSIRACLAFSLAIRFFSEFWATILPWFTSILYTCQCTGQMSTSEGSASTLSRAATTTTEKPFLALVSPTLWIQLGLAWATVPGNQPIHSNQRQMACALIHAQVRTHTDALHVRTFQPDHGIASQSQRQMACTLFEPCQAHHGNRSRLPRSPSVIIQRGPGGTGPRRNRLHHGVWLATTVPPCALQSGPARSRTLYKKNICM